MMKKFIFKVIIELLLYSLILMLIIFSFRMFYFNQEFPMWKSKSDYIERGNISKNLILGDSRANAGFSPIGYQKNYYNLSLGGSTTIEAYYTLIKVLENNKIENIILSFAPFHFQYHDTFLNRTLKFGFFESDKELFEVIRTSFYYNDLFFGNKSNDKLILFYNYFKAYNYYYKNPITLLPELKNLIYMPKRYFLNKEVYNKIKKQKGHYLYGESNSSSGIANEGGLLIFKASPVLSHYFYNILELASENNIQLYYIATPFNNSTFQMINEKYFESYNDYFKKIKSDYPAFHWHEKLFYYPDSCFGDASHLNAKGLEMFHNKVMLIIKE